jgi:hypothetical protein
METTTNPSLGWEGVEKEREREREREREKERERETRDRERDQTIEAVGNRYFFREKCVSSRCLKNTSKL